MSAGGQEAWPALLATQPSPPRPASLGPPHSHRAATQLGEVREQAGGDMITTRETDTSLDTHRASTVALARSVCPGGKPRLGDR